MWGAAGMDIWLLVASEGRLADVFVFASVAIVDNVVFVFVFLIFVFPFLAPGGCLQRKVDCFLQCSCSG